ncbi:MAG TPA: hypothetical protein V6D33_12095 [Cyanophyceae cyanobacterium]
MIATTRQEEAINRFLEKSAESATDTTFYPKETYLSPDEIILDCGTQSRINEDSDRIDDYARDMKAGDWDFERRPLPEVMLAEDGKYYAIDCHHRVKAARLALHPGKMMLFLVRKGSLAQARIWSASANTLHGLAADNSPQGVRKRIEMFLDNIELLSPEAYQEEFLKVPGLTQKEIQHGKFSDRTIERYLRLRPGQYVTVGNIRKEREVAAKILQHNVGDRIELTIPEGTDPSKHPDGLAEGEAGIIKDKDRKAIYIEWDRHPGAKYPIHPDFIKRSDKPLPPPFPPPRYIPPPSFSNTSGRSGGVLPKPSPQTQDPTEDEGLDEGETLSQEESAAKPTQSNIGLGFQEGDRICINKPGSYWHKQQGVISTFTDVKRSQAIILLDQGERTSPIPTLDLQVAGVAAPKTEEVEHVQSEDVGSEDVGFQEVRTALSLVCKHIPLLSLEEIEQLKGAIAAYHGYLDFAADKSDTEEEEVVPANTKKCKHSWSDLYLEPSDSSFKRIYNSGGMSAMRTCEKCGAIGKVSELGSILQVPQQKWAKHKQDAQRWASNLGKFSAVQEEAQP